MAKKEGLNDLGSKVTSISKKADKVNHLFNGLMELLKSAGDIQKEDIHSGDKLRLEIIKANPENPEMHKAVLNNRTVDTLIRYGSIFGTAFCVSGIIYIQKK